MSFLDPRCSSRACEGCGRPSGRGQRRAMVSLFIWRALVQAPSESCVLEGPEPKVGFRPKPTQGARSAPSVATINLRGVVSLLHAQRAERFTTSQLIAAVHRSHVTLDSTQMSILYASSNLGSTLALTFASVTSGYAAAI